MIENILLQASGGTVDMLRQFLPMGLIILVFYFFMIRPQQKKAKDQRVFREELKRGMRVVTIGGMHGKLVEMDADTVTLEVERNIRLTFDRSAISMESTRKLNAATPPPATPPTTS